MGYSGDFVAMNDFTVPVGRVANRAQRVFQGRAAAKLDVKGSVITKNDFPSSVKVSRIHSSQ